MNFNPIKIIKRSVFGKILLAILSLGLMINLLLFIFFRIFYQQNIKEIINENFDNYFEFIADDIGSPPDTVYAKKIADKYSLAIWYESDSLKWASIDSSALTSHRKKIMQHVHEFLGLPQDSSFVIHNADGSKFRFTGNFREKLAPHYNILILLIILISLVVIFTYHIVKYILKPVLQLTKGVEEISKGNLENNIKIKNEDEFGKLADSFNSMTLRINEMIKSREQLLLDVSHELRSPLTRIKMALEFLDNSDKKNRIESDIREMETMITEILESERLRDGYGRLQLTEADIKTIIEEIVKDYSNKMPGVFFKCKNVTAKINIDEVRVRMVIKNLIENAFHYAKTSVNVVLTDKEQSVEVEIIDDGIGIPEKSIPFLFEPFYRVDQSRSQKTGGFGLGLHLCKKIMDAHGGEIIISNNKTVGVNAKVIFYRH